MKRVAAAAVASLAALLLLAAPALAARDGDPVRFWELDKINRTLGPIPLNTGAQQGGELLERAKLGLAPFRFPETNKAGAAIDKVFSSADGSHYDVLTQAPSPIVSDPRSTRGGISQLQQLQAYRKQSGDATLTITITDTILRMVDENHDSPDCPSGPDDCPLLKAQVHFHARAYAASIDHNFQADGDFFTAGGYALLEGHRHNFHLHTVMEDDPRTPFWRNRDFRPRGDFVSRLSVELKHPVKFEVPLSSVHVGELFAVDVTLESVAVNDRGGESTALGFIDDPQHLDAALVKTHGLKPLGKPRSRAPEVTPPPAAHCPGGPRPNAGRLQFSRGTYAVTEAGLTPTLIVTRTGGSRGAASAKVRTRAGTATAGSDFKSRTTRVRFAAGDRSPRFVEIPILEDADAEPGEDFTVSLGKIRCAKPGKRRHADVTIIDDDTVPPPPPAFTVGGTVDGLTGTGLQLVNRGTSLSITGNGPFTFPGTFADGSTLDVRVQTQPTNPDEVCTVARGSGTITADVTDVAVHCADVTSGGLDPDFGDGGRITVPGAGEARAVLPNRDGHVITVGPRQDGLSFHSLFGATQHDFAGNPDDAFGTHGFATTSLGGADDKAFDAAYHDDGRFVTVGQADPAGLANTDFGVMAYTADGQPDLTFSTTGFRTQDIAGFGDGANAVVVQSDQKIVVAGFAFVSAVDKDFAILRYNQDGSLDTTWGGDGIVTTDFGTENDVANGIVRGDNGTIIAVGDAGEDVALAQYLPDGTPDPTFGGDGTVVQDLGFDDVANGVVAADSTIFVAGTRLGPKANLDAYVASFGENGKLNSGFGDAGIADADLSDGNDFGDDITLDQQGNLVVVGTATSATITDMALMRFTTGGTLDKVLTVDFHGFGDFGHAVSRDPFGGIVAAGSTANGGDNQFALMRAFF
jgi:uncharacterized delta-60 repeat protein